MTYNTKVYHEQGGNALVVDGAAGGAIKPVAGQAATKASLVITYSSNDPSITPDDALTISDGSAASVAELLEFCEELKDDVNAIMTALRNAGILAYS